MSIATIQWRHALSTGLAPSGHILLHGQPAAKAGLVMSVRDWPYSTFHRQVELYPLDWAGCIVISDTIFVILGTHDKFREFTPKAICDTSKAVEVLLNLTRESREEVDSLVAKAIAAGGSTYDKPEDFGFMYTHSFVDPDGHGWGLFHMITTPTQE